MKLPMSPILLAPILVAMATVADLVIDARGGGQELAPAIPTGEESPRQGATALDIKAVPFLTFDKGELVAAANQDVTITFTNEDEAVPAIPHNFAVYKSSAAEEEIVAIGACTAPCIRSVEFNLPAGEYFFRCDLHPQLMTGSLVVVEE